MPPLPRRALARTAGAIVAGLVLAVSPAFTSSAGAGPDPGGAARGAAAVAQLSVPANRMGYRWSVNGWTGILVLDGGEALDGTTTRWNYGYMRNDVDGLAAGTATPVMITDTWKDQYGYDGRRVVMLRLGPDGSYLQRYQLDAPTIFPGNLTGTMTHWNRQPDGSYVQLGSTYAAQFTLAPLPGSGLKFQNYATVVPQVGNYNWLQFPYFRLRYSSLASGQTGGRFALLQHLSPTAHSELAVDWHRMIRGRDRGFYDSNPVGLLGYQGGSLPALDPTTLVHVNDTYMSHITVWRLSKKPSGDWDGNVTDWWLVPGYAGKASLPPRPGSMTTSLFYQCRLQGWGDYQYCFTNYWSR